MKPAAFKAGAPVWFISKYGDRVTGTYAKADSIPGLDGDLLGHLVISDNAFGPNSNLKGVHCFVSEGHLRKGTSE